MLFVIVVVTDCKCRCWGTANYSSILMRGRKIGSRVPGIEPGLRVSVEWRYLLSSSATKEIIVAVHDSKHSYGFYPVARHTQTLFFGQDDYQMSMHLHSTCLTSLRTRYKS